MSTKKSGLWPFSLCPHASTWAGPHLPPLWTSTRGRHEINITLLKRLVQWPCRPKAEIRLYDCNLFKTVLLVIYIIYIKLYLYRRKISTFSSKDKILVKKRPTSLHEKKTGWHQWILIFCVDVHVGLDPPPSVHMRPLEPGPLPTPCGRHKWMAPYIKMM